MNLKDYVPTSAEEFIEDSLEVTPLYNSEGELYTVEVLRCTGGPRVELDTRTRALTGWWGDETADLAVDSYICDEIEGWYR